MRAAHLHLMSPRRKARWLVGLAALFGRPVVAYASSSLLHVLALGCLAYVTPSDVAPAFSMRKGDGGLGNEYSALGSTGGAELTAVFDEAALPTTVIEMQPVAIAVEPLTKEMPPELKVDSTPPEPTAVTVAAIASEEKEAVTIEAVQVESSIAEVPEATIDIERIDQRIEELEIADTLVARLPRRELASVAEVRDEPIELPPLEANGRGELGSGSGNREGDGNGGASGRAGGSFESYARSGPWNPAPVYPANAQASRMEGIVRVRLQIGADGSVKQAFLERSSGWPLLDDAAMRVVPLWRFEPARRGGLPAECEVVVPFDFYLRRS